MNSGSMIYVGGGRIQCTTAVPARYSPAAIPFDPGGILCVGVGVLPRSFVGGIPYGPNGRIAVDITGLPITTYTAGLPLGPNGRMLCTTDGPIAGYIRGLPVAADGRVCLATPIAVSKGVSDLDDDELPDTVLLDTPGGGPDITIDDNSINVDQNGDGIAETVTPRT